MLTVVMVDVILCRWKGHTCVVERHWVAVKAVRAFAAFAALLAKPISMEIVDW